MKYLMVILLMCVLTTAYAYADGKFYWQEEVPPDIPYQRALLLFDDGTETLILQSQYSGQSQSDLSEMGWVVPLPAVPELASMPSSQATHVFWWLDRVTSPHVIRVSNVLIVITLSASVLLLILCLLPSFRNKLPWINVNRRPLISVCALIIVIFFLAGLLLPAMSSNRGVEVLKSESVGMYDVKVIASSNSDELIAWLNNNGFKFDSSDTEVFSNYLNRGWCFTVAHVNASTSNRREFSEGLPDPLVLRFSAPEAIYPLGLTSTGDHDTEILLYVASEQRMTCGNRLPLGYVGKREKLVSQIIERCAVNPSNFFSDLSKDLSQIMKFKGILSPDEMKEDLIFTPDPEQGDHRNISIVW